MYSRFFGRVARAAARKDSLDRDRAKKRGEREASAAAATEERNSPDCTNGSCGRHAARDARGQAHVRTLTLGCHAVVREARQRGAPKTRRSRWAGRRPRGTCAAPWSGYALVVGQVQIKRQRLDGDLN